MVKPKNARAECRKRLRESGSQTDDDSLQEEDSSGHCCEASAKLAEVNTKLDRILLSLTELEALKEKVSSLENESKNLKDSIEFAHNDITDLKSTTVYACSNIDRLGNEITSLKEDLDHWKRRSIRLESYSRRENIKIFNIQETADEDTEVVVKKFLSENLKIPSQDVRQIRFERVHRIPTRQTNKPRPIIARFSFFQDKEFVWSFIKNLKGTNTAIANDYPKEIENIHKALYPVLKKAKQEKNTAFFKVDRLIINGQVYKGNETINLPFYGLIM